MSCFEFQELLYKTKKASQTIENKIQLIDQLNTRVEKTQAYKEKVEATLPCYIKQRDAGYLKLTTIYEKYEAALIKQVLSSTPEDREGNIRRFNETRKFLGLSPMDFDNVSDDPNTTQ
jgi:hypothetical protein